MDQIKPTTLGAVTPGTPSGGSAPSTAASGQIAGGSATTSQLHKSASTGTGGSSGAYGQTSAGSTATSGGSAGQVPGAGGQHGSSGQGAATTPSASQIKDQAQHKAQQAVDAAKGVARDSADQVKRQAGEAATRLREQAGAVVGQQKDRIASELENFTGAVRQAADKLYDSNDDNLAGYASALANQLDRAAHYLRETPTSSFVSDAQTMMRRRPELFAGGMFVAGLALARFLKASSSHAATSHHSSGQDYGRSYGGESSGSATQGSSTYRGGIEMRGHDQGAQFSDETTVSSMPGLSPTVSPGPATLGPGTHPPRPR